MAATAPKLIDPDWLAAEFPLADDLIYLNHAGVAPWPARTAAAVRQFAEENARYGGQRYKEWLRTEQHLREQLQRLINAPSPDDIGLVKNTSEALSMVAGGIDWRFGDNVVSSNEEFPSNRIPWEAQRIHGVEFREVDLRSGESPETALIAACDARTRVLTISSVQYGSGLKLELETLGKFCREKGILFCVDAIQSLGAHRIDVQAIQADFIMADAHKWLLGPEGIALFYSNPESRYQLKLHEYGWHMVQNAGDYDTKEWRPAASARRFECGSPNMLGIYGFSASLSLFEEIGMDTVEQQILEKSGYLIEQLQQIGGVELVTPLDPARRAGIVTFRIKNQDPAKLHQQLMQNNIICAARFGGIRFSPHFYTSTKKIHHSLQTLTTTLKLKKHSQS